MQTQIASAPSAETAVPSKRNLLVVGFFGLQALVIALVSFSVFNRLLIKGCEEDARRALHLIAQEMDRDEAWPEPELGAWMSAKPTLRHRLGDARFEQGQVHYHGYLFQWIPGDSQHGTLSAQPITKGKTGKTTYHLEVVRP